MKTIPMVHRYTVLWYWSKIFSPLINHSSFFYKISCSAGYIFRKIDQQLNYFHGHAKMLNCTSIPLHATGHVHVSFPGIEQSIMCWNYKVFITLSSSMKKEGKKGEKNTGTFILHLIPMKDSFTMHNLMMKQSKINQHLIIDSTLM